MSNRSSAHSRSIPVVTADEAMDHIRSGDRIYLHEAAMAPIELMEALVRRAPDLRDVETVSIHTEGPAPHTAPTPVITMRGEEFMKSLARSGGCS